MLSFIPKSFLRVAFLSLVVVLSLISSARAQQQQQQQQDTPQLSAEQIIAILQQNPDVLAEAKSRIAQELQARGYVVQESDITDDRLFSEIRSDERVRSVMNDFLVHRGFGADQDQEPATNQQPGQPANQQPTQPPNPAPGANAAPNNAPAAPQPNAPPSRNRNREDRDRSGAMQQRYPLRNLPAIRDLYSQSVVDPAKLDHLERFGAALFKNTNLADKAGLDVPVGPDYVLGPGDELVVQYWGSASQRLQLSVDREGRILLPEAGAVMLAGVTLAQAQQLVRQALQHVYRDVTVAVSLGKLRMVRVYVVGDVVHPGAYEISALSTPLNALLAAGGPTDAGSLRVVQHLRGNKIVGEEDLYDLLLKGMTGSETRLESGDSIRVPVTGPQVTVAGMVRRPAIYELHNEQTLDQVLELAGGVPVSGDLGTIKVERTEAHERKLVLSANLLSNGADPPPLEAFKRFIVKDGDRILVLPILPYSDRTVYLQGHVFRPGKYPYRDGEKVTDIISSFDDLMPEPADRAEIVRLRPPDNRPDVISFDLREVMEKRAEAPALKPFDTVRIYGRYETDAPKVAVYGDVLRPGEYPLSDRMSAADLVRMAGGFKRSAFTDSADLASYTVSNGQKIEVERREVPIGRALAGEADTDVRLKPGDTLTIRQLGNWNEIGGTVTVLGQVLHPGKYAIEQGSRISDILQRAGGFLPDAYPNGANLERVQVREIAAKNRDNLVRKLQAESVEASANREPVSVSRQRQVLIDRLKQIDPSGRLVIRISPDISKWQGTTGDIPVRPGDTLIIPKQPNFVQVAGQVYNPTAISYTPGRSAAWYLGQAGGQTKLGSRKDAFIIRANGSILGRASGSWWSGSVLSNVLQPGDTVYVPDKITGSDKMKNLVLMGQMLSGVAVAAGVVLK